MVNLVRKLGQPVMALLLTFAVIFGIFGSIKAEAATDEYNYDGMTRDTVDYHMGMYVRPHGSSDYGEVAYCFNYDRHFPPENGAYARYAKDKGTADLFVKMADTPRLDKNLSDNAQKEDFYKKVLTILYNGYPRDNAGLQKKYNLSNAKMRMVTQLAVWYMTDSKELDLEHFTLTSDDQKVFHELLARMTTTKLPSEFGLNLFTPKDTYYQNLLSSGIYFGDNPDTPVTPDQPKESKYIVNFSKVETGKDVELPGATLKVVKGESTDGEVVSQWTSGTSIKSLELSAGTYTMVETESPKGYDVADPITFRITDDGFLELKKGASWMTATSCVVRMEDQKKEAEKVSVPVTKKWNDGKDQDGVRPNMVIVNLYANGQKTDKSVILSEGNNWKSEFTNLDKYDDNDAEIKYTVQEVKVNGYTSEVSGDAKDGFTVENTHKTETVSVEGKKTWNDGNDNDKERPGSITVRLYKDGKEIDSKKVTKDNNWSWKFDNLDKYKDHGTQVVYTITEDQVANYTSEVKGYDVTNTYEPKKTSVSVVKKWNDGNDQDGLRAKSVEVQLYADGDKTGETLTLNADNNWSGTFQNLNEYKDGEKIKYTIKEAKADNYESTVTGSAETGYVVENTHKPTKTSVEGSKTWNDSNDNDGKRPDSITIRLYRDGTEVDSKKVTASDNWSWKFDNLDKYRDGGKTVLYTVTEDAVEGYTSQVDGYNVTNSYEPKKVSVSVTKSWKDNDDRKGDRPDQVTFTLYADGKSTGKTLTLTEKEKWAGAFTDLPKYENGKEVKYTVKENKVDGYSSVVSGDMTKGFVATNSYNDGNGSGSGNSGSGSSIDTGDHSMMKLYIGLALAALAGVGTIIGIRRKTGLN